MKLFTTAKGRPEDWKKLPNFLKSSQNRCPATNAKISHLKVQNIYIKPL
jgi:hypothetical protein